MMIPSPQSPMQSSQDLTQLIGTVIEHTPIDTTSPFVWPPAIGWWIITFVFLIACLLGYYFLTKHLKQRAHHRYLKSALDLIVMPSASASLQDQWLYVHELNKAMKAIAIEQFGAKHVSRLTGESWLEFLDQTGRCQHFTQGAGNVFGARLYQPQKTTDQHNPMDLNEIQLICQQWCKEIC